MNYLSTFEESVRKDFVELDTDKDGISLRISYDLRTRIRSFWLKIYLILGFLTKAQVKEDEGDDYDEKRFKKIDTNGDGK